MDVLTRVCVCVRLGSLLLLVLCVSLLHRDPSVYGNIMYDRRIVRGNTYALHTLPAVSECVCVCVVGREGVERGNLAFSWCKFRCLYAVSKTV